MNVTMLVLLAIPALTGLNHILWARLVRVGPEIGVATNALAYSALFCVYMFMRVMPNTGPPHVAPGSTTWPAFCMVTIGSALICAAWVYAVERVPLPVIGFVEIAYPLFVLIFTPLLVGPVRLSGYHWVGGAMVLVGIAFVLIGENATREHLGDRTSDQSMPTTSTFQP